MEDIFDVIILGAGAAGLTAGIYTSRAKLSTLILNEGAIGGQMTLTNEVANYPGVHTTSGYELATTMKEQAKNFGCKIKSNIAISHYDLKAGIKSIFLKNGQVYRAKSVIIAAGGVPRTLPIPGEEKFRGKGISFCATCDGEFFTNKEVVVVGGGNSALEEAVSLSKHAKKITIVHQFDHFQAFKHAILDAEKNPKINFIMESELLEFKGDQNIQSVIIKHLQTEKISELKTDGVFLFIGYSPKTESFKDIITLNERGEIPVDADMKTNIEGVFAAGDCIAKRYRQVTTSTAEGTIAALSAADYLNKKN